MDGLPGASRGGEVNETDRYSPPSDSMKMKKLPLMMTALIFGVGSEPGTGRPGGARRACAG